MHTLIGQEAEAVENLSYLSELGKRKAAAAGTDGKTDLMSYLELPYVIGILLLYKRRIEHAQAISSNVVVGAKNRMNKEDHNTVSINAVKFVGHRNATILALL